jgi:ubiquinone/menaquinone biosynthesis C-methylase UbiE
MQPYKESINASTCNVGVDLYNFIKRFSDIEQKSVLEIGCGNGGVTYALAPYAKSWHAIDISSSMIDDAIKHMQPELIDKLTFDVCDFESIDEPVNTYDIVFFSYSFHYMKDFDSIYNKIKQLLNPHGVLWIREPGLCDMGINTMFWEPTFNMYEYINKCKRIYDAKCTLLNNNVFDIVYKKHTFEAIDYICTDK